MVGITVKTMVTRKKTPENTAILTRRLLFWMFIIISFFAFLYMIKAILLPFVLGILIAYFLDPAADKLERWGLSRGAASGLIILGFFAILLVLLLGFAPTVAKQITGLISDLPSYVSRLQTIIADQFGKLSLPVNLNQTLAPKALLQNFVGEGTDIASGLLQSGFAILNLLSLLVLTPVVAFYLLRDWDIFVAKIDELFPRSHASTIREQIDKVDETLAGFIRGQINVMLILGVFYAVALLAAGLKYAIIIGLICGFLIIVPYIGAAIGGLLATGIALVQFDSWERVAIIGAIFVAGQMLEGYALTPKLVGDKVGLHPVWIIFGMLAGATLFGFVGILIAVPVTAVIGVMMRFAVDQYEHSAFYTGK